MRRSLPSLQRLRALEAVLRLGGFSAAAEELLLTQSAVSNQIKRLEDETGVLLIERIGKRVKPTPEGGILLAAAGRMTAELAAALMRIADMQGEVSGRFVIGAGGVASTYHLPPLLARFAGEHPKAEVDLRTGNTGVLAHGLIDGTIDIIVATGIAADARLTREPFADDRLICVVPPDDETTLQAVGASDLAGRRLVLFEKRGRRRLA
ncbi:MAG: LysR family transcriptional regulator [Rhodospirillales bacterium]|nr:LysR family transcriptional regulator [Rhodospirillales bacterium]